MGMASPCAQAAQGNRVPLPCPPPPHHPRLLRPASPAGALTSAIAIPRQLPSNKALRARFISFLHRMVEALGPSVLPYLPSALEVGLCARSGGLK